MRTVLVFSIVSFAAFFIWAGSGFCQAAETGGGQDANEPPKMEAVVTFTAENAPAKTVTLGSTDPKSGFNFLVELNSKGAAISKVTFSDFYERNYKEHKPLVILSPVRLPDGREISSMANKDLVFVQQQQRLSLDELYWKGGDVIAEPNGSQMSRFEADIIDSSGGSVARLIKTYKVFPGSYHLDCELTVENLGSSEQKVQFGLEGPVGIEREDPRSDTRKVVAGFRDSNNQIASVRLDIKKLSQAKTIDDIRLIRPGANFLWVAAVNKYFAAILVPVPEGKKDYCDWVTDKVGQFYNLDGDASLDSGDEAIGVGLRIGTITLAAAGTADSSKTYNFQLYIGPKDKEVFDKNQQYRNLGFFQVIDFMPCFCCPTAIINPLAFGILAAMKWMYGFIPDYGTVIIILVFLIRIVIHPLTRKSQVSMSRFGKLAPKVEEIKQKYANNKVELNKQLMQLYRKEGASPIMGMLPMFVQMPVWIALYSAIDASIDLRGAPFKLLPFWITDLSAPDALFGFPMVNLPLLGKLDSLNLLPLLMGVAFYLQQKLTPQQPAANPQAAQQQKMMLIMMPILFPLMLYKAPSGLNLYIMASTFAGVIEQYVIKKHIREKEEQEATGMVSTTSKMGGKIKKKKPKPFFRS